MSFVERNKTWLLPVLAVGVAAMLWFDLRSAPAAPTAAQLQATSDAAPATAPIPAQPSPAASGAPLPALGPDAWSDLSSLNMPPDFLLKGAELTAKATRPLTPEQLSPPRNAVGGQLLAAPATLNLDPASGPGNAPPPRLEFISRTPEGLRAWYDGTGFQVGQIVLGTVYRVRAIQPPRVVLEGPGGLVDQSTFVLGRPEAAPSAPETP